MCHVIILILKRINQHTRRISGVFRSQMNLCNQHGNLPRIEYTTTMFPRERSAHIRYGSIKIWIDVSYSATIPCTRSRPVVCACSRSSLLHVHRQLCDTTSAFHDAVWNAWRRSKPLGPKGWIPRVRIPLTDLSACEDAYPVARACEQNFAMAYFSLRFVHVRFFPSRSSCLFIPSAYSWSSALIRHSLHRGTRKYGQCTLGALGPCHTLRLSPVTATAARHLAL